MTSKTNLVNRRLTLVVFLFCFPILLFSQGDLIHKQNKEIVQRYFDSVKNNHDLTKFKTIFAANHIWHSMDGREISGLKDSSHISTLTFIFNAIPDIHYLIENIVTENDMVAVNTNVIGTANSEFFGFQPSHKKVEFKQMFFFRLSDKKVIEKWEIFDMDKIKEMISKK